MILQVNARGSWATIAEFAPRVEHRVRLATIDLARALTALAPAGSGSAWAPKFRIVTSGSRSPKALAYLEAPWRHWRTA